MKYKSFLAIIIGFLFLAIISTGCNNSGQRIYTVVPDDASVIGSFNPGKLLEKANPQDVDFIKTEVGNDEFSKALFENPEISGIDINAYSCFFISGADPRFMGVVMPLKKQKDFENFLDKLVKEYDAEFKIEEGEKYSYSLEGSNILAWNKSLVIHLTRLNGWGESGVKEKLDELFSLEKENSILSEKDFKSFLSQQKDINLWATSSQLESLTGTKIGALNMLGAINNNYAHVFLEFQKGAIVLSSNLVLNPDFKKNFDKFNVIDQDAGKEILKMLPAKDLILAGNFRINSTKMLELLKSFNLGGEHFMEEFLDETGKKPEEIIQSVEGSIAFSINGITPITGGEMGEHVSIPVIVAVMQVNEEKIFEDFINLVRQNETSISEENGYYIIKAEEVPFFLAVKNKNIILTNQSDYISEILASGEIKENLMSLDISKALINNPICVYLNLDRQSYSDKVNDYIDGEMNPALAVGLEGFGKSLKSLTLSGNIEKSELKIEFKDNSVNSLHAILQALN